MLKRSTKKIDYDLALGSSALGGIVGFCVMIIIEWVLGYEIFWEVLTGAGIGAIIGFIIGLYTENYTNILNDGVEG